MNRAFSLILALVASTAFAADNGGYCVVVSQATRDRPEWSKVVDELVKKHNAHVITYQKLDDALPQLTERFPRYACFVATSAEAGREFVAQVHRLTRKLDSDPYTDVQWGILTGYDAKNALDIAATREPLIVKKVASGTEVALDHCREGIWYSELEAGKTAQRKPGGEIEFTTGSADSTAALAKTLSDYRADLFVTSGHATERNWQIGFRYQNGYFVSQQGQLFGLDTKKNRFPITAPEPKVYLPIGNCLMGHIDGPDAMALAFMNSAGVKQMMGYTVNTWFGYGGWGCLDYFIEQPGRYTFTEAFHANHHALIHKLTTESPDIAATNPRPGDFVRNGLLYDRDVVALYGDPAWEARLADGPLSYGQSLQVEGDTYTFTIEPKLAEKSFAPVNTNGSQRGGRPFVAFFPHRVRDAKIIDGGDLKPVVTDNFILVPNPLTCDPQKKYQVRFTAERMP
jgi:zinc protease